jgi:DNA polymerase III delta subunit
MLYVFHGSDIDSARKKAYSLINSLRTKKPDAAFIKVEADEWNTEMIKSHLESQGLFSNKYIVFLDRVTEKADARDGLLELLSDMKESPNIFIVLEATVKADLKKSFDTYAEKVVESEKAAKEEVRQEFNIFALADAIGSRDVSRAWMLYRQAVDQGAEAESILGTLFWQAKSMVAARYAASTGESGLNPFVFSKSKKYASNFSDIELQKLLKSLITIYHDAHRGIGDAELSTERFLLGIGRKS